MTSARIPAEPAAEGRLADRAWLSDALAAAQAGQRQLRLLGSEPGLGKTWLVGQFLATLPPASLLLGRSQCVDLASAPESFGPWLALLDDLAAGPAATDVLAQLRRCAPTWLLQLPWLLQDGEADRLRHQVAGAGTGRMLREAVALFGALARPQPLVLVLEDLHWADDASIDLLAALAHARTPARLLILTTWRPVDARLLGHPLAALAPQLDAGLQRMLDPLDDATCRRLLQARGVAAGPGTGLDPGAIAQVQAQASGNPLVLLSLGHHLLRGGVPLSPAAPSAGGPLPVPARLRQVVAARLAALPDFDRRCLQVASLVGLQFTPRLVAAALQVPEAALLPACAELAARGVFVRALPADGAGTGPRFAFLHDAYRQALVDSFPLAERQAGHGHIAACLAADAGAAWHGVAAAVADGFVQAARPGEAAHWLGRVAEVALARFDPAAAAQALRGALAQLALLPPGPDRQAAQLQLYLHLGNVLQMLRMGHPGAADAYAAADALALALDDTRSRVRALLGLCLTQVLQGQLRQAADTADALVLLAQARQPCLEAAAHTYAGLARLALGELDRACHHCETALVLPFDPEVPAWIDLEALARLSLGRALVELGRPDAGLAQVQAGLARSRARAIRADRLQTLYWAADAHRVAGCTDAAAALFAEALADADVCVIDGFVLAARFGLLACAPPTPGRSAAMAELLQQLDARGERWNAAGFALVLAQASLADGDLPCCRRAVSTGLLLQGGDHGTRHQAALLGLAAQVDVENTLSV